MKTLFPTAHLLRACKYRAKFTIIEVYSKYASIENKREKKTFTVLGRRVIGRRVGRGVWRGRMHMNHYSLRRR